ncbi:MAG: LysM peptidoglycan-binding domain-containing protein [Verrucomicrobiaceae bacterium]
MKTASAYLSLILCLSAPLSAADQSARISNLEREVSQLRSKVQELKLEVQRLSGRTPSRATSSTSPHSSGNYRVKKGDTFWGIAKSHRTTISRLQSLNPRVNPSRLLIGTTIQLPGSSSSPVPAKTTSPTPAISSSSYRVKSGDTLGAIAGRHKVNLKDLLAVNPGVNPQIIQIGQKLNLPRNSSTQSPPPVSRPVASGKPTPKPSATPPRPTPATPPITAPKANTPQLITVSENRRLDDIARFYGTDVSTINRLNEVSLSAAQIIKTGSQIYVPKQ